MRANWRILLPFALALLAAALSLRLAGYWISRAWDAPALMEATPGRLLSWMSEQAEEEEPESLLGRLAKARLASDEGIPQLSERLLGEARVFLALEALLAAGLAIIAALLIWRRHRWRQSALVFALTGAVAMLFLYSAEAEPALLHTSMATGGILLLSLLLDRGRQRRWVSFFALVSALFLSWELVKLSAELLDYRITQPMPGWQYESYPELTAALDALEAGQLDAVIADRRELDDWLPPYPANPRQSAEERDALPRQALRYLRIFDRRESTLIFPSSPEFPTRLTIAVRAAEEARWSSVAELRKIRIGTPAGSFAEERYLTAPRSIVLLNLRIYTDLNLPHLQDIARAFWQPARRNGPFLLVSILAGAAFFTLSEAVLGFAIGAALGFVLGSVFAHSRLLERSLLPFVVASQTVPILAFAPMVVIWLGASAFSVAVIAAYLTFFPVTINTLRGLLSPPPAALELMRSFAAGRLETLWKLKLPAALPYIFAALKVSATASVVGAIIGELPSGISDGLGRAIINFSSDYSLVSTPKLWASIVSAAAIGILFFLSVSLVEWRALRHNRQAS